MPPPKDLIKMIKGGSNLLIVGRGRGLGSSPNAIWWNMFFKCAPDPRHETLYWPGVGLVWANVCDDGPGLSRHRIGVSCLLGRTMVMWDTVQ